MRTKTPVINVRYQSHTQVARLKRAAKLRKWSLNTFVVYAADLLANQTLAELPAVEPVQEFDKTTAQPAE